MNADFIYTYNLWKGGTVMSLIQSSLGAFVWSKMGSESGETLNDILHRKEIEREANDGNFVWGIGSSLGKSIERFMWNTDQPKAVFTPMKSKPKPQDANPARIVLWRGYIDSRGNSGELPRYSFVISRYSGKKHYALLCNSDISIVDQCCGELDSSALVNYLPNAGVHKKVGGSQVTSVVKNVDNSSQVHEGDYRIQYIASLYGAGQVILKDEVEISVVDRDRVMNAAKEGNVAEWKTLVEQMKH